MKMIITGGAGMIGSHCAEYFSQRKNKVVVIDNLLRSTILGIKDKTVEYNWHYLSSLRNIKLVKNDIRDRSAMMRIFHQEKPDVVIHTAGQPSVKYSLENPLIDYEINATGTINILEALYKSNKKGVFIYTSTNKVYGDNVNAIALKSQAKRYAFKSIKGVDESCNVDATGHTPYGVSKLAGDLYTQEYAKVFGLKSAVFRMSCIYGARQFGFEDQGWLAWFVINSVLGKPITIYGDGKQVRDVLWVGDLIKAFDLFLSCDASYHGEVFNIGGGSDHTISLLELIQMLEALTGRKMSMSYGPWRKFDQKVYVSDISKIQKLLKWNPEFSCHQGIHRVYDWVLQNEHLLRFL